jgi:hypothetical protein
MSLNLSNYEQAQYVEPPVMTPSPIEPDNSLFARAVAFGLVGAVLGALIYALFVGVTGISIGYLAILVAYMVAKAMTIGSHERGGRKYQITALLLTYLALAASHSMIRWWFFYKAAGAPLGFDGVIDLVRFGLVSPVFQLEESPFSFLIGLVILFVGLRAAWRMTSGEPGASKHPFSR